MSTNINDKTKWNERYAGSSEIAPPSLVLTENAHLLPDQGRALDLACGLGGNALFLAREGLTTTAWDISSIAIEKLQAACQSQSLTVTAEVRDVVIEPPSKNSFDVIVVSRFLDRTIIQALVDALAPGGLVYYQTFIVDRVADTGPGNPEFLLNTNELLQLFNSLTVRVYREEGRQGEREKGFRNEAMLVAQKLMK